MKTLTSHFVSFGLFLIILLWVYAASSKLIDMPHFEYEMHAQVFYPFIQTGIIYLLPAIELITAGLLIFDRTVIAGLYVSLVLMTVFTAYILLVILHVFRKVPCSCGGILEHLGWTDHFWFNLTCISLIITTLFIIKKKGVAVTTVK